jgi:hypothetical protein
MAATLGIPQPLCDALQAGCQYHVRTAASLRGTRGDLQGDRLGPQALLREHFRIAGQALIQMMSDLRLQTGSFLHQVPTMTTEDLQCLMDLIPGAFLQAEPIDGGSENGRQVVVIRFDVQPRIVPRFTEGSFDGLMIGPGHLDAHDDVPQVMPLTRLIQMDDGELQPRPGMSHGGGSHEHSTIEVTQHPFGARFGAIDRDNAKVFRSGLLDARLDYTGWLT